MAPLVIDLGSDSEEESLNRHPQVRSSANGSSVADKDMAETKPSVKSLAALGSSSTPEAGAEQGRGSKTSEPCRVYASSERPLKRIKTEHEEGPGGVMAGRGDADKKARLSETNVGAVREAFVDMKPKLEPGQTAGAQIATSNAFCVPAAVTTTPRDTEIAEKFFQDLQPPITKEQGTTPVMDRDVHAKVGTSEQGPREELEEGEIEDVDASILEELEEEVRRHTELLRRKQEELEKGAGDPAGQDSGLLPNEDIRGGSGLGEGSRALVPAFVAEDEAPVVPPRRTGESRQFWHAGEYEVKQGVVPETTGSMAHVRVHPKFLHSNATSHKWALGAVAELLDNALDEVHNGATYVSIDMELNPRAAIQAEPMLVVEDNGGGMDPDRLRKCMSLGYSAKTRVANTIGQYGNGFKTSTMRLGADVIVFTRCPGADGRPATQSIGLLSFTFLRKTGHEDIVVPMVDFEVGFGGGLRPIVAGSSEDHVRNLNTICEWSPFATEDALLQQFTGLGSHGTRVVIFNLWENDDGLLELDFETDARDILLRGGSRDEDCAKAEAFPDSSVYFTYMHSLRSYASILYLELPPGFRIFLRGVEVQHHRLVHDLRYAKEMPYRPHMAEDARETVSVVTRLGFWKDSPPLDVQGFNVYHKNRLIKPFWRVWNSASSSGRGVVGVLEANFVEPAHDKQGFESTPVLQRLEKWLARSQKAYWNEHCVLVGYQGVGRSKKTKPGSDPAYHGPSARSPRDDAPGTPVEEGAGLDSPWVGDPGTSPAAQPEGAQSTPGAEVRGEGGFGGVSLEDQPIMNSSGTPSPRGASWSGGLATPAEGLRASWKARVPSSEGANETSERVGQLEAAVREKDALLAGLEARAGKLVQAVTERDERVKQLATQLEEGKETARLLNIALAKLRGMKAALTQREATIEQQKAALTVAEGTVEELQREVTERTQAEEAARREMDSVREKGEAKVRYLQTELNKERGWNGERSLQLVKMEEELAAARAGGGGAALAEAQTANQRAQEKLRLLARDHVHLRQKHAATLEELADKGRHIQELERRLRDSAASQHERRPGGASERERKDNDDEEEKRAAAAGDGNEAGPVKKSRRTSDSSEVLEGAMLKWAVPEERSVSQRSAAGEGDDLRADMQLLKEEMQRMKELLAKRNG